LYVADSKLCSKDAMGHIAAHGGPFVTVIPHGRREDTWFRDWAQTHAPAWVEAHRSPGARLEDPDRVWRTFTAPAPSVDGYRVIWVHSSAKAARGTAGRAARIEAGLAAIQTVQARLSSPKSRLKTLVAAEAAATPAPAGAENCVRAAQGRDGALRGGGFAAATRSRVWRTGGERNVGPDWSTMLLKLSYLAVSSVFTVIRLLPVWRLGEGHRDLGVAPPARRPATPDRQAAVDRPRSTGRG
jgi:hypothetical protein